VRVLSLGCGPARALADVLEQPGLADSLSLTAVDDDQEAIVYANNLLKSRAPLAEIAFHQIAPRDVTFSELHLGGFDIVASLFAPDNVESPALAATLRHAGECLLPGGVLLLAAFTEAGTDRWVTDLFLNWRPAYHEADALRAVLSGPPFGGQPSVALSPTGLNLIVRASRADG
jgi:SAM-dependent methyltransferase